jgi:hypothetical protein
MRELSDICEYFVSGFSNSGICMIRGALNAIHVVSPLKG